MSNEDMHKQADHFAGIVAEKLDDKLAVVIENLDGRIESRISPLQSSIDGLQSDVKDVKLDRRVTDHDHNTFKENMEADMKLLKAKLYKQLDRLDERVDQFEKAGA